MIILTTSALAQELSVIPRSYSTEFTLSLRDDSTNVKKYYEIINATTVNDYLNFSNTFDPVLVENHFYDLQLYIDYNYWNLNQNLWNLYDQLWNEDLPITEYILKDRIFCTDQDINQLDGQYYKLNKGQYNTYNDYDNTYLVI